jgi:hypothetical protein
MKKMMFVMMLIASICGCKEVVANDKSDFEKLLDAICIVESNGKADAVGDNGKAVGAYQLHKIYVDDVNSFPEVKKAGKHYTYEDRLDPEKSREITRWYLIHYGRVYQNSGKTLTLEVFARIHNGGPNGYKKKATEAYWVKVKAELDKM